MEVGYTDECENTIKESELLARIAGHDREAFTVLYTQYLQQIYQFVYLFTKSKDESEELSQEVFIKVWIKRESLGEVKSFRNYLFRMTKNLVIDHIRKQRQFEDISENEEQYAANPKFEADIILEDSFSLLERAVHKLPQKRRQIFEMNVKMEMSLDEIAEQMNISKSVVKKQLYAARHSVKEYLMKYGELGISELLICAAWLGYIQ
ncbi:sigma-70 family RNA polymerase sigma factor [Marinilongibacter aquaticus]|uniref:RNA polymerase sigma factor n=1 Tax=Marinilongibacter aquaticus TaxID=2975157 RepID=UPI0021BDECAE|nr:sigma-70 family RNA polymerase sigma factor [Marinilongibacter aquaticus]UBM61007.1 sigma-70 family RNA polymerase sigma factor [Marinilongibacter aquaticus]